MQLKRWDIASFGTFVISGNIKPVIEIQDPHLPIPEIAAHLLYHSFIAHFLYYCTHSGYVHNTRDY